MLIVTNLKVRLDTLKKREPTRASVRANESLVFRWIKIKMTTITILPQLTMH
jgi:hypothetical protein